MEEEVVNNSPQKEVKQAQLEIKAPNIAYIKEGPKLGVILSKNEPRDNLITAHPKSTLGRQEERTVFTERQGIANLVGFLNSVSVKAEEAGKQELKEKVEAFRDNLVYLGESELREAIETIATRIKQLAQEGKNVYLYYYNKRSEGYMSIRALEDFDYQTENTPDLRTKVKISGNTIKLAETVAADPNAIVMIIDDFIASGGQVQGFAEQVIYSLGSKNIPPEEAIKKIEVNVVAAKIRNEPLVATTQNNEKLPINVHSYFGIKDYKDKSGIHYVHTGISLSGSHSSTDYGFEVEIEDFIKFAEKNNVPVPPLPINIIRPYETNRDGTYQDLTLQHRWEKISDKYGLKNPLPAAA